jgi:hypothetical protein
MYQIENGLDINFNFFLLLFISVYRYRDTLLRLMTPGHTRLYLLAFYYDEPGFTG